MKKPICLILTHSVFITKDQRYELSQNDNCKIEAIGISTPTWCRGTPLDWFRNTLYTTDPAEEVICKYYLTNSKKDKIAEAVADGYNLNLYSKKIREDIVDIKDYGCESTSFNNSCTDVVNGHETKIVHFITIQDIRVLEKTLSTAC